MHWNMKIKLSNPNIGYSVVIRFEKPICDIGRAIARTIKIPLLKGMLKVCSKVLLME